MYEAKCARNILSERVIHNTAQRSSKPDIILGSNDVIAFVNTIAPCTVRVWYLN